MISLRDYQQQAIDACDVELSKFLTALLVLPTGAGKTRMFIAFIEQMLKINPNFKFVIVVNKIRLLKQALKNVKELLPNVDVKIYCGGMGLKDLSGTITIATIQSIHSIKHNFDFLILDECHNINMLAGNYKHFIENNKAKLLAVTATPYRADGVIYGKDKLFNKICYQKSLLWAIKEGYLVQPRIKHTEQQFETKGLRITAGEFNKGDIEKLTNDALKLTKQVDDALPKLVDRQKVVWACSSIRHAEDIKRELEGRGELAVICHSDQSDDEFDFNFNSFETGDAKHLTFVSIISEGIDIPQIDAVVLMRPTRSPALMVQVIGRGLRTYLGKVDCLVLDYGNVVENCGPLDAPFVKEGGKSKKDKLVIKMKFCPECYEYVTSIAKVCPCCEYSFVKDIERDYQKNLSQVAVIGKLLSSDAEPTTKRLIDQVSFKLHKSKAGNECLKISYHNGFIPLDEYLALGSMGWKIKIRLKQIFELRHIEQEQIDKLIGKTFDVRFTLLSKKVNGYDQVESIIRERDSEHDLGFFEQEEDIFF